MANRKTMARKDSHKSEKIKFLKFGMIPLVVLVLIIVIIIADSQENGETVPSASATAPLQNKAPDNAEDPEGESDEGQKTGSRAENGEDGQEQQSENADGEMSEPSEPSLETADPSGQPLLQDSMLELTGLVRLYCEAKTECDPELLAQVFGTADWPEERKDEERANMELVKASVKSYENISCYSVQGPETDSYVIFPYYEIRYRETESLMPSISWAYVRKDESGQYFMVEKTDEYINEYIRKVGEKPEVKAVIGQVRTRQQEAIASDEVLQGIYGGSEGSEVIVGEP